MEVQIDFATKEFTARTTFVPPSRLGPPESPKQVPPLVGVQRDELVGRGSTLRPLPANVKSAGHPSAARSRAGSTRQKSCCLPSTNVTGIS